MGRLGIPHLFDPEGFPLFSLLDINRLPPPAKERIYHDLIPESLLHRLGPDSNSHRDTGSGQVRFVCPEGLGLVRIDVRRDPHDSDPLFFVEVADTPYGQIELSFCLINDPDSPRFSIDKDEDGRDNCFGTVRRNIPEEVRALEAGLSPNQVRSGMHLFSAFFARFEYFVDALGVDAIVAEPLSYSNAIRYERYGFDYVTGKQLMLWINREFRPGGVLHGRLDGTTPFRRPGMEKTVRGRSWAIHDGILGFPWDGVKIYKVPGVDAGIDTFPEREF